MFRPGKRGTFFRTANGRGGSIAAVIIGGLAVCGPLRAQEMNGEKAFEIVQQQIRAVYEKCSGAVVKIEATDDHGRLSGTGFFIDPNGTLYTCYSVGGETRDIVVTLGETRYPATRVIGDMRSGVAILKVEAETPFLTFGKSRDLVVASPVMTIGYPMDLPASPSFGMVAGFDIKYLGRLFAAAHIRANVPVQRGQGGAPLLNFRGEVVGILISSLDQGSASFALPIEAAEKVRRDFLRFHEVRRAWLGVQIGPGSEPVQGSTAQITDVLPDSPGVKAGLQAGDVLLQVGDRPIRNPEAVLDAAFYLTAEDEVTLRIARGGEALELRVQSAEHPSEPPNPKLLAPAHSFGPGLHFQPGGDR